MIKRGLLKTVLPIVAALVSSFCPVGASVTPSIDVMPGDISSGKVDFGGAGAISFSGAVDASDLYAIGEMDFTEVDLSRVSVVPYSGEMLRGKYNYPADAIPAGAFAGSPVSAIIFPQTLKSIQDCAFMASGLKSVAIPRSVTDMGTGVFMSCRNLVRADVECDILGDKAFEDCGSLLEVSFTDRLSRIGDRALAFTGIVKLDLSEPSASLRIGEYAFAHCRSMTEAVLPTNAVELGVGAFFDCPELKTIICNGLASVPALAFAMDKKLDYSAILGEGTIELCDYSMANNASTSNLKLPSTLERIGDKAMAGWTSLAFLDAVDLDAVPHLGADVWDGVIRPKVGLAVKEAMAPMFAAADQWRDFDIRITSSSNKDHMNADGAFAASMTDGVLNVEHVPANIKYIDVHSLDGRLLAGFKVSDDDTSLSLRLDVAKGKPLLVTAYAGQKYTIKLFSR